MELLNSTMNRMVRMVPITKTNITSHATNYQQMGVQNALSCQRHSIASKVNEKEDCKDESVSERVEFGIPGPIKQTSIQMSGIWRYQ